MNPHFETITRSATGATAICGTETIQSLWSGYGEIVRCHLEGTAFPSVIVKHVRLPEQDGHPRGWNTDLSHARKVHSYQVETAWYRDWSDRCGPHCRIPKCLNIETVGDEVIMVMEDLNAVGYPARRGTVGADEIRACLVWLAHFHATFLGSTPTGLWPVGTYWHLETRPDELEALNDRKLKDAASDIDRLLSSSPFQTLVHGDAKLANFCFSPDGRQVAAVDFQYVGGGCGMKDVAYFISSCMNEAECERHEIALLDLYFAELRSAVLQQEKPVDADALEADWRALYPVAWTDFYRFLQGWSPGHWKIHRYSERLAREVLEHLHTS